MIDIDAIRARDNAWLADREAYEKHEIRAWVSSEAKHDRHALLTALDKAVQQSWDTEEYANRKHRALRMQAAKIRALRAEIVQVKESVNMKLRYWNKQGPRVERECRDLKAENARLREDGNKIANDFLEAEMDNKQLRVENADMRETLETISQIGTHKMDREAAQHCLDRHKGQT